jgi:hypothetical protein
MYMACYNFYWRPGTLGGYRAPAKAAGLADRARSFAELFERIQQ